MKQFDEFAAVVERLRAYHNSAKVVAYEDLPYDEYFAYYDKGTRQVSRGALRYVQEQVLRSSMPASSICPRRARTKGGWRSPDDRSGIN